MKKGRSVFITLCFLLCNLFVVGSSFASNQFVDQTHLRCFYQANTSNLTPRTDYVRAIDPKTKREYVINGYWWEPGLIGVENMFYSDVKQDTLRSVCEYTLTSQGIRAPLAMYAAADSYMSLNYTVWTLDTSGPRDNINRIVSFGDSLSDMQNIFNASDWKLPNASSYFAGRFSNGKNWLDYLSDRFGLTVYNWAVGGAAADNYYVIPGVEEQVTSFINHMNSDENYQVGNTLFTMLVGGNDLANYGRSVDSIIQAELAALTKLIEFGGKNILLVNLPDVSRAPIFNFRKNGPYVGTQVKAYNQRLLETANYLRSTYGKRVNIHLFDTYTLFDNAMKQPEKFGFTNTTESCLNINSAHAINYLFYFQPRPNCTDADNFVFWDLLHPTTHAHRMLAQNIGNYIENRFH